MALQPTASRQEVLHESELLGSSLSWVWTKPTHGNTTTTGGASTAPGQRGTRANVEGGSSGDYAYLSTGEHELNGRDARRTILFRLNSGTGSGSPPGDTVYIGSVLSADTTKGAYLDLTNEQFFLDQSTYDLSGTLQFDTNDYVLEVYIDSDKDTTTFQLWQSGVSGGPTASHTFNSSQNNMYDELCYVENTGNSDGYITIKQTRTAIPLNGRYTA